MVVAIVSLTAWATVVVMVSLSDCSSWLKYSLISVGNVFCCAKYLLLGEFPPNPFEDREWCSSDSFTAVFAFF